MPDVKCPNCKSDWSRDVHPEDFCAYQALVICTKCSPESGCVRLAAKWNLPEYPYIVAINTGMKIVDGVPRRNRLDLCTPAELAIRNAILAVEAAGCDPLLTEAVVLLGKAQDVVADFVDGRKAR